jgi:hypothetical protein
VKAFSIDPVTVRPSACSLAFEEAAPCPVMAGSDSMEGSCEIKPLARSVASDMNPVPVEVTKMLHRPRFCPRWFINSTLREDDVGDEKSEGFKEGTRTVYAVTRSSTVASTVTYTSAIPLSVCPW